MISRNERRLNKKATGKGILEHPAVKRFRRNLKRVGREALEVYRIDGDTPDQHVYFDVFSMREWSIANVEKVASPLDWDRAEQLVASGAVDREHITTHTIQNDARPIIVGRLAAGEDGDQILDGAHTYVAMAMAATASGQAGQSVPIPTYLLEPDQWRQFVIPNHIARALEFDATIDSDDRRWSDPAVYEPSGRSILGFN